MFGIITLTLILSSIIFFIFSPNIKIKNNKDNPKSNS